MKEALYFQKENDDHVRCNLCPQYCDIASGKHGNCRVRVNQGGILYSTNYGRLTALNLDPIEKKPLYHFHPGKNIFSVGSAGCNLHCKFCQNSDISQSSVHDLLPDEYSPELVVSTALKNKNNIGIAYTYNEPTVFYEFMMATAMLAKEKGLKNVAVTNGFINPEPLKELAVFIDAFNVDLKFFSETLYNDIAGGKLAPVCDNLKFLHKNKVHFEITHLVVTGLNDKEYDFIKMVDWIGSELGADTVLHISRYFPRYRHSSPPTPEDKLMHFYTIARKKLNFVYLGNVSLNMGHDTICPACNATVIARQGYMTDATGLDGQGNCMHCGKAITSL